MSNATDAVTIEDNVLMYPYLINAVYRPISLRTSLEKNNICIHDMYIYMYVV